MPLFESVQLSVSLVKELTFWLKLSKAPSPLTTFEAGDIIEKQMENKRGHERKVRS